jgi:hypothetical protein
LFPKSVSEAEPDELSRVRGKRASRFAQGRKWR